MKNSLILFSLLLVTTLLWSTVLVPASAQLGWTEDDDLAYLTTINGISIASSNSSSPIVVDPGDDLIIGITLNASSDLILRSMVFSMIYLGIPFVNQPIDLGDTPMTNGTSAVLTNTTLPLGSILSYGGISLVTGTILGNFSVVYSLQSQLGINVTLSDDFVLYLGTPGFGSLVSVVGLVTVGFTVMSVFGLLLALDDFQQGILAARRMRRGKSAAEIGIFPSAVILRRKPKKDAEKFSKEELIRRVSQAASNAWEGKRCPKCGKRWQAEAESCPKCRLPRSAAVKYFSDDIADYAPKALGAVAPKSRVPVGKFSKRVGLKPDKGGALAAALTEMGVFQTRSVKVPLKKVAFSGLAISGTYWSWMQILSGATPSWLDVLLMASAGLVVSVLIGYFMNWLARVPPLGYDK
jgi:hypothetical protein